MNQVRPLRRQPVLDGVPASIAAGLGAALLIALLLWRVLPYEALELVTPYERFWAWEGAMWMLGLALTLLAISVLIEVRQAVRLDRPRAGLPAAQWVLMSCGAGLIALAVLARLLSGG
jgi:hypothetical protein